MSRYRSDPQHRELAKARSSAWYYANTDKVRQRDRVDRWHSHIVSRAVSSAKARGHEHAIDGDFVLTLFKKQNGLCYWTGVPMVPSVATSDPQRPSIDRLDGDIGYVPENCVLACWFANLGRGSVKADRFRDFIETMKASIRNA